jgi:hypothetical protein
LDRVFAPIDQFIEKQSQKCDLMITSHPTQSHLGPVISVSDLNRPRPTQTMQRSSGGNLNSVTGFTILSRIG